MHRYNSRLLAVLALAFGLLVGTSGSSMAADLAAAKATVDAAKSAGTVGEQGDGYLGLVTGSASPDVTAAVNAINEGRRDAFAQTAAKTGTSPAAAGQAAAAVIFPKIPAGQYYKPLGGSWTQK